MFRGIILFRADWIILWQMVGLCFHPWGRQLQMYWSTLHRKVNSGLHCPRNWEKHIDSINCSILLVSLHIGAQVRLIRQHLAMAWLCSGHNSPLLTSILHQLLHWPYGTPKGWVSLADPFLGLQLMNQVMDGNQRVVLIGVILPLVCHHGSNWHLLFFNLQQAHNRGIFQDIRQGRQLFNLLYIHGGYTKSPLIQFWVHEVPSPGAVYAKNTWGLWAGHNRCFCLSC